MIEVSLHALNPENGEILHEDVLATRLAKHRARIATMPVFASWACRGDVVELEHRIAVRVTDRAAFTCRGSYNGDDPEEERLDRWQAIQDHFDANGLMAEDIVPGWFAIAVPLTMTEERLREIEASCPKPAELQLCCRCCGPYCLTEEMCRATEYAVYQALRPMNATKKSNRHAKRRKR